MRAKQITFWLLAHCAGACAGEFSLAGHEIGMSNVPAANRGLSVYIKEGQTKRSQSAKVEFKLANPCPANGATKGPCAGYVIDHMWPLACGGEDHPRNMQWQTIAEGKAKDKWERKVCGGQ